MLFLCLKNFNVYILQMSQSRHIKNNVALSTYVMNVLGIEDGPQDCLIAVKASLKWKGGDPVLVAARALKEHRRTWVPDFKLCYEEADKTVYCLGPAYTKNYLYSGYVFSVGDDIVTFYKAASVVVQKNSFREFLCLPVEPNVYLFTLMFLFLANSTCELNFFLFVLSNYFCIPFFREKMMFLLLDVNLLLYLCLNIWV